MFLKTQKNIFEKFGGLFFFEKTGFLQLLQTFYIW